MYYAQIESQVTTISLLITAITVLGGVVGFLFMYNKHLNKEMSSMSKVFQDKMAEVYKEQIKDNKEVIANNTKAVSEHTNVVEENIEVSKELKETISTSSAEQTKALQEMRLWMRETFQNPRK